MLSLCRTKVLEAFDYEGEGDDCPKPENYLMLRHKSPTRPMSAFERVYQQEHVPMAIEKLSGKTRIVATRVAGAPAGDPPYYRIAEVHFPSMEALQARAGSADGQAVVAHAVSISSGGAPLFLIAEEQTLSFE